jgi:hypothetical protein
MMDMLDPLYLSAVYACYLLRPLWRFVARAARPPA